jgi:RNA polymerase sigma-70 factor (ECF subfamily)
LHTTRWHVADQFRKRPKTCDLQQSRGTGSRSTPTADRVPDPHCDLDKAYEDEWKRNLQEAALERVKNRVKPKQYQAFFLYAIKALPMQEITGLLGLNRNQVYLAKLRITRLVAREVKRLEREIF